MLFLPLYRSMFSSGVIFFLFRASTFLVVWFCWWWNLSIFMVWKSISPELLKVIIAGYWIVGGMPFFSVRFFSVRFFFFFFSVSLLYSHLYYFPLSLVLSSSNDLPWCNFFHVSPAWSLLMFLDLWVYSFNQV